MTTHPSGRAVDARLDHRRGDLGCGRCGLKAGTLPPNDALAVLRSLPGRWRDLLDAQDHESIVRDRGSGWSALQRLTHVADRLHATVARLEHVRRSDDLPRDEVVIDAPHAGDNDWNLRVVLAVLAVDADRLGLLASSMTDADWHRTARRNGHDVSALDLLREAVHASVHHLRETACQLGAFAGTAPPLHVNPEAWGVRQPDAALARSERRRHRRIPLVVSSAIERGGEPAVACTTSDVSESGVRLRTDGALLAPGPACLVLTPPDGAPFVSLVELLETRPVGQASQADTHAQFLEVPAETRARFAQLIAACDRPAPTPTR